MKSELLFHLLVYEQAFARLVLFRELDSAGSVTHLTEQGETCTAHNPEAHVATTAAAQGPPRPLLGRPGGRRHDPQRGMTITDAHLVQWAGLTGDLVSLHLDETYAAETPFGQRIAHGPLTLSLGLGLMTQTGYFSNVVAWLGLDGSARSPRCSSGTPSASTPRVADGPRDQKARSGHLENRLLGTETGRSHRHDVQQQLHHQEEEWP